MPTYSPAMRLIMNDLAPDRLEAYFAAQPADGIVGRSFKSGSCPVYTYLEAKGHRPHSVGWHFISRLDGNGDYDRVNDYDHEAAMDPVFALVRLIDNRYGFAQEVTAAGMLELIRQVKEDM